MSEWLGKCMYVCMYARTDGREVYTWERGDVSNFHFYVDVDLPVVPGLGLNHVMRERDGEIYGTLQ